MPFIITHMPQTWPVMGFCEYGNEPSGFIEDAEFFELLRDYELLRKSAF